MRGVRETREKSISMLRRSRFYHERAYLAVPILVRHAELGSTITYGNLAREIGLPHHRPMNYILGSIGAALSEISLQIGYEVPPFQLLAINKSAGTPGRGAGDLFGDRSFLDLSPARRREIVFHHFQPIFEFDQWDKVLDFLGVQRTAGDFTDEVEKARIWHGRGGEGEEHRAIKEFIRRHPASVGIRSGPQGEVEYSLPSGDALDVYFARKNLAVAIEVKPSNAPVEDLVRGIFQCVKYKAVLEAMQACENRAVYARAILVTPAILPDRLIAIKNALGVEVIEGFKGGTS